MQIKVDAKMFAGSFMRAVVKNPGWVGYTGAILPISIGIIIRHYKDPYQPTSIIDIIECHKGFDHCSCNFQGFLFGLVKNPCVVGL